VEFVIVVPLILLTLIGVLELGRAVMVKQILTNGAREGARKAILPGATTAGVTSVVTNYFDNTTIAAANRVVAVRDSNGNDINVENLPPKEPVHVFVSVPFDEVSFGLSIWLGGGTLSAQVVMRKEQ
jgi:hypothetical protein